MQISDLSAFDEAPFFCWVKDEAGVYLWGNQRMTEYAGMPVAGVTDFDISSAEIAEALRANDNLVRESGLTHTFYENVDHPTSGKLRLSVCKYPGNLAGKRCVFGVSFPVT